jgi:hypothetical protein
MHIKAPRVRNATARLAASWRSHPRFRLGAPLAVIALTAVAVVSLLPGGQPTAGRGSPGSRGSYGGQPGTPRGGLTLSGTGAPARLTGQGQSGLPGPLAQRPVTLLTGDMVRLTPVPGGRSVVSVTPPKPGRGAAADTFASTFADTFEIGGDVYAVPGDALPYLGSRLDPRLFDVSYLQRAGYASLTALPLSITWQHRTHPAIPGVSAPAAGLQTTGSISVSSASVFGRALTRWHTTGGGALAQVKKIALGRAPGTGPPAGAQAAATGAQAAATEAQALAGGPLRAAPAVPISAMSVPEGTKLFTLTVNAIDTSGQPGNAVIAIQNLDSFRRYYSISSITPGQPLSVSVPSGPYAIEAVVYDTTQQFPGIPENLAFVSVPQVNVSSDTVTTVDARQAKPITITVPDATAVPALAGMLFTRLSADHNGLQNAVFMFGPGITSILPPVHMYAAPAPPPRTGSLSFADSWELTPPDSGLGGVDPPYSYSLDFASADGVPATLSRTLTLADLATVHDSFASSVPASSPYSNAYFNATPFHPWSTLGLSLTPGFSGNPVPAQRTDYFSGSASTVWALQSQIAQYPAPAIFGPYRTFRSGDDLSLTWGASPSVPAPEWQSTGLPAGSSNSVPGDSPVAKLTWSYICPVCRQGDVMEFNVPFSGDSDLTHTESWFGFGSGVFASSAGPPTDAVKFYRNGILTQLASRSGGMFPMLPGKASYAIDWASTIPVLWTQLATSVHSVWTFTSARPAAPDRLPRFELCTPDTTQACSFVPLVFASYDFGANLQGQVPAPGTETFTLTGYHQANEQAPPVTRASVQVSFDDGATWSPAGSVTSLGGGRFMVTVTQPAPSATSGYASFKVKLADAAGDTLTQTITRAYALSGTAAASRGTSR